MSFRTKQKFSITGFYPCFARVEVKKKDKVTFEEKDLTLSKLPKPGLFNLGKIVESGNVSKLEYRGHGHGKALIKKIAAIACERGCGRLEWSCLDWNTPSIDFYLSLGAEQMNEWTVYRFEGERLAALAGKE